MGTIAQIPEASSGGLAWLWELVRNEILPYKGRAALVARMVTASTLVMILSMTFRIPYGAYGAIYALILSRESVESTANAVRMVVLGFVLACAYILVGSMLVLGDPMLRLLWVLGTFFLIFYVMSAFNNYAASARFAYLIVITIPLWDRRIPAGSKVEDTLWAAGAITLGSVVTLLLEVAVAEFRRADDLVEGITERLAAVEDLLSHYAEEGVVTPGAPAALIRLASVGTSRLRRLLQRSDYSPQYAEQMGAVVALAGRLVDIAANVPHFIEQIPEEDRRRLRRVVNNIAGIRTALVSGAVPQLTDVSDEIETPSRSPLLREIEKTVALVAEVFTGSQSLRAYAPLPADRRGRPKLLVPGALSNPEHIKFGLRGCLAASLCYLIYNSLFWPGISTAVTTCLLTALSTIGASHQKQVLRFAGALVGGVVIGMGSQIFLLPYIDSIGGFTVLYVAVATLAAWFATSSPRLSYFGVQIAVAFCLIHLQEFAIQTSLAVARDRVMGILLGLFIMWLAFDQLWSAPAGVEMKKAFVSTLRLLAQYAREPISGDLRTAIERSYVLRETINTQFDNVRSLADGVLFEFGSWRRRDLALRDRIRRWQPQLRSLFVMRIASTKYRLQLPGFELPPDARAAQREFDERSARMLEGMADRIEQNAAQPAHISEDLIGPLEEAVRACCGEGPQRAPSLSVQTFITLLRGIDGLTTSLAEGLAADFNSLE